MNDCLYNLFLLIQLYILSSEIMTSFQTQQNSARDSLLQMSEIKNTVKKAQFKQDDQQDSEDQQYRTTVKKSEILRVIQQPNSQPKANSNDYAKPSSFIVNKMRDNPKKQQIKGDPNYDPLDLTYTLLMSKPNIALSTIIFFLLLALRYYTIGCLIYVVIVAPTVWEWIFVIIIVRIFYLVLVMRVSLNNAQTKTEIILKRYWNSKESDIIQLFEVTDKKKLLTSILRGLIPPQLSFIYIKAKTQRKRFEIFTVINYIYASMEMIVYYPFFITYCIIINPDNGYALNVIDPNFTVFLASVGEIILFCLSGYLLLVGIYKRFGTFLCCCN